MSKNINVIPFDTGRVYSNDNISQRNVSPRSEQNKPKNKCLCFSLIVASIVILVAIVIGVVIFISQKGKNDNNENTDNIGNIEKNEKTEDNQNEQKPSTNQKPLVISKEEAMEAFKSNFNINTKAETLTQLKLISTQNYNTTTDGIESSYSIFTKAKYDIYTLNESLPGKDKDFYSKKYSSVITVNSLCSEIHSSKENDCELKTYLDLNAKNSNNLRRIDEADKEQIKKAVLPICIIEHTDTNIILSVTCPETLAKNIKDNIILAFQSIKPDSVKDIIEDQSIAGTTIERKDNKIYIKYNFF